MSFMKPEFQRGCVEAIDSNGETHFFPDADLAEMNEMTVIDHTYAEWCVRLSAPGYLDCTDWTPCDTIDEGHALLEEMYDHKRSILG